MANATWTDPLNLIVPNGVLKNSSDVFYILDPDTGGAATFSVPLSADGAQPATYWGASTPLTWPTYEALTEMSIPEFMTYVNDLAAERGREPVGSVTAFKSAVQINGTLDFWDFATSRGLQPIRTEEPV